MTKTRRCSKCGETKKLECFYKDSSTKDGLRCWCKDCCKAYEASPAGKAKNKAYGTSAKGKAKHKKYKTSPAGKAKSKAYEASAKGKASHKVRNQTYAASPKGKASYRKQYAKRQGIPQEIYKKGDMCELCGSTDSPQADHLIPISFHEKYDVLPEIIGSVKNMLTLCAKCNGASGKWDRIIELPCYLNRATRLMGQGIPVKQLFPKECFWNPYRLVP